MDTTTRPIGLIWSSLAMIVRCEGLAGESFYGNRREHRDGRGDNADSLQSQGERRFTSAPIPTSQGARRRPSFYLLP